MANVEAAVRTVNTEGTHPDSRGALLADLGRAARAVGEHAFLTSADRAAEASALEAGGWVVVRVKPGGATRGRLGATIDDAVERALASRDAATPLVASSTDRDATISDQVTRARRAGALGLCVAIDALRPTAFGGALDADDVTALRALADAARVRPLRLLLDVTDAAIPAALDPPPLASVLGPSGRAAEARVLAASGVAAIADRLPDQGDDGAHADRTDDGAWQNVPLGDAPAPPRPAAPPAQRPTPSRAAVGATPVRPYVPEAREDDPCRSWTLQLTAARGPQPLAAFERLFAQAYLPLANAVARGEGDLRAVNAVEEFRRNFEKTYLDVCPTFAVTGKRPRMVLDVPDIASRIARLHGARTVHLLLVDSMRYDIGARVCAELGRALGQRATLTDDLIVWSAMPTTTPRQLDGLARGIDVLRTPPPSDRGDEAVRGRTAEVVRRVKVGSRDVYKLDIVESRLAAAADKALDAIPSIAEQVSATVVRHAEHLAARTLLVVFGDHGFRLEDGVPRHGGASPEEVLVPAFAFLVADVH